MSPVSPARRRADRFARALDGATASALDPLTAELLDLVAALRSTTPPTARPGFVSDLRSQLVLAAETELRPARVAITPPVVGVRTRRERRIAVALGGFALVGAPTSMAIAAQSALPDETLYPLKRAIENADAGLSADDDQGTELLSHASSRLAELDELAREQVDEDQVPVVESTLDTFSEQADEAATVLLARHAETGDPALVDQLHVFAAASLDALGRLEGDLPAAVRPAVLRAAETLFRIDDAATRACPDCAATGITQVPGTLVAATVANETLIRPLGTIELTVPVDSARPAQQGTGARPKPTRAPTADSAGAPSPAAPTIPAAPALPGNDA
ncbi:MAG: DUF5667 domain-containing protein, partial [Nocardioides sp.]|nr:DUF5667 domain-containing protein [Nocardioides sp.]